VTHITLPRGVLIAVFRLLACFPLVGTTFYLQLGAKILIMAIFALSLDLLVGHTGLVSLGHAAYFGIAAYALALVSPKYEAANIWLTLPAAMAVAAAAALVIGFLVVRTAGVYFIMITLPSLRADALLGVSRYQDRRGLGRHLHSGPAGTHDRGLQTARSGKPRALLLSRADCVGDGLRYFVQQRRVTESAGIAAASSRNMTPNPRH